MEKFIELTANRKKASINIEEIAAFVEIESGTKIFLRNKESLSVDESYEVIKRNLVPMRKGITNCSIPGKK
jgi:hypothetical protein